MKASMFTLLILVVALSIPAGAAERHMMQPLVPVDKLAEARALRNPLPSSSKIVEQGKALYLGKGGCVTCHGIDGDGKGPAAASMNPSPPQLPAPRFLAASHRRGSLLGHQIRVTRHSHDRIRRGTVR
jgi:mono/diheme cytochrome c family protein